MKTTEQKLREELAVMRVAVDILSKDCVESD